MCFSLLDKSIQADCLLKLINMHALTGHFNFSFPHAAVRPAGNHSIPIDAHRRRFLPCGVRGRTANQCRSIHTSIDFVPYGDRLWERSCRQTPFVCPPGPARQPISSDLCMSVPIFAMWRKTCSPSSEDYTKSSRFTYNSTMNADKEKTIWKKKEEKCIGEEEMKDQLNASRGAVFQKELQTWLETGLPSGNHWPKEPRA